MSLLLPMCDVLIASEADAEFLFGIAGEDFTEVAEGLIERFGVKTVVGTRREASLVWRNRFGAVGYSNGQTFESAWYEVEIVDRLGAGDAMAAGLIHGLLDGDLKKGLDYGAAMGALVAVAYAIHPELCETQPMHITVDDKGFTRKTEGTTNAEVCLQSNERGFLDFLLNRVAGDK